MGEAKRRGSYEERVKQAKQRQSNELLMVLVYDKIYGGVIGRISSRERLYTNMLAVINDWKQLSGFSIVMAESKSTWEKEFDRHIEHARNDGTFGFNFDHDIMAVNVLLPGSMHYQKIIKTARKAKTDQAFLAA